MALALVVMALVIVRLWSDNQSLVAQLLKHHQARTDDAKLAAEAGVRLVTETNDTARVLGELVEHVEKNQDRRRSR